MPRQRSGATLYCNYCSTVYYARPSKIARSKMHFCSPQCYLESIKIQSKPCGTCGIPFLPRSSQSKYCSRRCGKVGELNPQWRGDDVKYFALHDWVRANFVAPAACEHCGGLRMRYEWANKTGKYLRDRNDWLYLCRSCHLKHDYRTGQRLLKSRRDSVAA